MKKKNLIVLIFNTILCIVLLTIMSLAWYTKVTTISNMSFEILQIDSLVSMYQANDSNYNGIPDILGDDNINKYYNNETLIEYSDQYYQEKYSFNYLDQKYALSSNSSSNLLNTVELTDVLPSRIYTFKFEITNYSGSENSLTFTFNSTFDYLDYRITYIAPSTTTTDNSTSATYKIGSWNTVDTDNSNYKVENAVPAADTTNDGNGRLDVWLQIKVDASCEKSLKSTTLPFTLTLSTETTNES